VGDYLRLLVHRLESSGARDRVLDLEELRGDLHEFAFLPRSNWSERFLEDLETHAGILEILNCRTRELRTQQVAAGDLLRRAMDTAPRVWKVEVRQFEGKVGEEVSSRLDCCSVASGDPPCQACRSSYTRAWELCNAAMGRQEFIDSISRAGAFANSSQSIFVVLSSGGFILSFDNYEEVYATFPVEASTTSPIAAMGSFASIARNSYSGNS